jgi:CBS domain-containing protein
MVDDPLVDAARVMVETRVHLLPVVGIDGTLCGIVTPDDIVAAVAGSRPADRDLVAMRPRAIPTDNRWADRPEVP